ncbi:MAG: TIM barrel protein, partial [Solirubrobacteraceae bacterium]
LDRPAAARRAGFGTIETAWPERAADRSGLVAALAEQRLEMALLNLPAGDVRGGERGHLNDPARTEQTWEEFLSAVELAERVRAPTLNVLVGRELSDVPIATQRDTVVAMLARMDQALAGRGLRLVLEPLNDRESPGFLAPTVASALELLDAAATRCSDVLIDLHHIAAMDADAAREIDRAAGRIGHVQVSAHPGRRAPGSGELDLWDVIARLTAAGYSGPIGLEYEPAGATEDTLGFLADPRAAALL